jgi:hypothetical protein
MLAIEQRYWADGTFTSWLVRKIPALNNLGRKPVHGASKPEAAE